MHRAVGRVVLKVMRCRQVGGAEDAGRQVGFSKQVRWQVSSFRWEAWAAARLSHTAHRSSDQLCGCLPPHLVR